MYHELLTEFDLFTEFLFCAKIYFKIWFEKIVFFKKKKVPKNA